MQIKNAMHTGAEWCSPETPVAELALLMREKDIGAVPIGENDRLIGIVTDRDIVCRGLAGGQAITSLTARDVMTEGIVYCRENDDVATAIQLMEDRQLRRLPVINQDKRLVGMLSLGDLAHATSRETCGELAAAVAAHH